MPSLIGHRPSRLEALDVALPRPDSDLLAPTSPVEPTSVTGSRQNVGRPTPAIS
jgi:hypothetical protein